MTDYEVLKAYGFSAFKALEIDLDSKRNDPYARAWVRLARVKEKETAFLSSTQSA